MRASRATSSSAGTARRLSAARREEASTACTRRQMRSRKGQLSPAVFPKQRDPIRQYLMIEFSANELVSHRIKRIGIIAY